MEPAETTEAPARRLRPHEGNVRPFGNDTSPEVERYLSAAYRRMSPGEKIARVRALNQITADLALADIREKWPDATEREAMLHLAARRYGTDFVRERFGEDAGRKRGAMTTSPIGALRQVTTALESLDVAYCIGGSFASSVYGPPRSTNDVDLVVALRPEHIPPLVAALEEDFMIDPHAVASAIAGERSFNVIAYETLVKVDIFVMADRPWSRQQLNRRRPKSLVGEPEKPALYFASPEDVILSKLAWYRRGGEVSDQQWRDILGVLTTQADTLEWPYLRRWATELGVSDLLTRAADQTDRPEGEGAL